MITLKHAYHRDNDVLEVHGVDPDGNDVSTTGWISATTNYFPPEDYNDDGTRKDGAAARSMTPTEIKAYCQSLLDAAYPDPPQPIAQTEPDLVF